MVNMVITFTLEFIRGDNGNGADNPAVSVDPETLIEKVKDLENSCQNLLDLKLDML